MKSLYRSKRTIALRPARLYDNAIAMPALTFRICALIFAAGPLLAQHAFSENDIEDGGRLYEANCSRCHGAEGNLVAGVDFARGKFLRASTDQDLVRVIRTGIPAAGMPPGNYSDFRAETIVAYLRSMGRAGVNNTALGDPVRGRSLFEGKGGCLNCHRVNGHGSRLGPDLSDIGSLRRVAGQLKRSILEPDAEILPPNRFVRLITKDGATMEGRLLNQDTFSVQLIDSKEQLVSILRSNLREFTFAEKSPMPSYRDKLSSQEIDDILGYLVSLKGL
jgi:putative heme-binding domain-containing protein